MRAIHVHHFVRRMRYRNGLWRDHPQRPASTDPSFASNTTDGSGRSSSAPLVDMEEEARRRESLRPLRLSPLSVESSTSGGEQTPYTGLEIFL